VPTESVLVDRVALDAFSGAVANTVAPSLKVTVPVGVTPETVAVKVTDWPKVDGFKDEVIVVLVDSGEIPKTHAAPLTLLLKYPPSTSVSLFAAKATEVPCLAAPVLPVPTSLAPD